MEMTKSKITQIVIGVLSLALLVLSVLGLGGIIDTGIAQWLLAVLIVSFGFSIIEVIMYFVFTKRDIIEMIGKWLVIFFGVIILAINTVVVVLNATTIFADILATTGWFALMFVVLGYILCAAMVAYLIFANKEEKEEKEAK